MKFKIFRCSHGDEIRKSLLNPHNCLRLLALLLPRGTLSRTALSNAIIRFVFCYFSVSGMGQVVSGEREKKLNENILGNSNKCFRGRKSNSKRERRKTGTSAAPVIRSLRLRDGNKVVRFNSLRRNFKRATRKTLFSRRPLIASDWGRHATTERNIARQST